MKNRYPDLARAGAILAFSVLGSVWSAHARADDEAKPAVIAARAPEQVVRLPALKVGGIRSGYVMLITESGTENVKSAVLAQRQMAKPSPFSDFCNTH
jgi:hypothetical protein